MNQKIIITGGTGFVGSNLIDYLIDKGYYIHAIVRETSDLSILHKVEKDIEIYIYDGDLDKLISYFNYVRPELVFHLASNFIAEHEYNQVNSLINSNILFGTHLLEAMRLSGVKKLINTGTSWQHYNNENYNPVCLYAATKQAYEALIKFYVKSEDFKVITLKLFDTYGETDTRPKLINLLNKFAEEKTVLRMSPGEQILNLVHVYDVCNAFFIASKMLDKKDFKEEKSYAVKSNETHSLKKLISIFEEVSKKKVNVVFGGREYRKREVMTLWDKGELLPEWSQTISLSNGLKRIIER